MANSDGRIRSLDSLLLFLATIFGLLFSTIYLLVGYRESVYGFFPLLILGLAIPIYVGYVRGAILLDMLEKRVRGWIYFIYGVVTYLVSVVIWGIQKLLLTLNIEFELFYELFGFIGIVLLGYLLGSGKLHHWFCNNIFEVFNRKMTTLTSKIYVDTAGSAFLWVWFSTWLSFLLYPASLTFFKYYL